MDRYHFIDYYKILSVEPNASAREIEESHRILRFRFSNRDILPDTEEGERREALLEEAFSVLSDPDQRARYDRLYRTVYADLTDTQTGIPEIDRRFSKRKRDRIIFLATLVLVLSISLFALLAYPGQTDEEEQLSAAEDGVFKVALLVPSTITDGGWSQSAYRGLMNIERDLGAEIVYEEVADKNGIARAVRQYGDENYDLIIGHGYQYSVHFKELSHEYKDTIFLTNGGVYINNNLSAVEVELEKVSYIAGAIAAKLTESGKLGCIGGEDIPSVSKTFNGFRLGAQSINPDIEVQISYIGNWNDPRAGYEEALIMIRNGVDILYGNANATGLGVIKAAEESGVYVFGQDSDQSPYAPEQVIASMFQDTPKTYMMVARSVLDGTFERGKRIVVGFQGDHMKLLWNDAVRRTLPESVVALENVIKNEFMLGNLEVPGEQDMR